MIKKIYKNLKTCHGFTLIEMMIVLMIISILLLIAVPNMLHSQSVVRDKSTQATVKMVQSQIAAYEMDHDGALPDSLQDLVSENYVSNVKTADGKELNYNAETGEVSAP
ncbi:MAG: prepilin-type N-terminal cleavage/methylation domain-containing protein [Sporolactobacillus sp.]|jgi:competence protein ComGC|nr:prepilin-type N-terminal cleavage/methylation domain-containing protein [Sporolactobacillus sp.]